jgi:hypothetical protein
MGFGSSPRNTALGTGWECLAADGGGLARVPSCLLIPRAERGARSVTVSDPGRSVTSGP